MDYVPYLEYVVYGLSGAILLGASIFAVRKLILWKGVYPSPESLRIQAAREHGWWRGHSNLKRTVTSFFDTWRTGSTMVILLGLTAGLGFVINTFFGSISWGPVDMVWQVHAAIVGLSFVVIVFLMDFVTRSNHVDSVLERFVEKSFVKPVLYFSLLGTVAIGFSYLYSNHLPAVIGADYAVSYFVITVLGILAVYYSILRLVLDTSPDEYAYSLLKKHITRKVENDAKVYQSNKVIEDQLSDEIDLVDFRYGFGPSESDCVTIDDLDKKRYVSDIKPRQYADALNQLFEILQEAEGESSIVGEETTVRSEIRLNQDAEHYSVIVDTSQDLTDIDLESVEKGLDQCILTTSSPPWSSYLEDPYEFVDYLERKGVKTVRNGEFGSFSEFMANYGDVVMHVLTELEQQDSLFKYGRYFELESPFYNLERIFISVFSECLQERDREQALETATALNSVTRYSLQNNLQPPFRNFIYIYSSFVFELCSRKSELPEVFVVGIIDEIAQSLNMVFTDAVQKDCDNFDSFDVNRMREESYSFTLLEEIHKMLKYALDVKDARTFIRIWEIPSISREQIRLEIGSEIQSEINQLLFSAASLSYSVAKQNTRHKEEFEKIYDRKLKRFFRDMGDVSDIYFAIQNSNRNPPRWTKWETQEHDVIQGSHGRPVFLDNEITEFYCFLGIYCIYHPEFEDENPIEERSISESNFQSLRFTVQEIVRNKPLFDLEEYMDEEDLKEHAEQFLEYHKEIVEPEDAEAT
ncbi:hypothetical protein RH858_10700 [Halalkaliarchaeum sp. AArc-GB]|uniref:hypothetical protein n=1 Tax=Halalkaliarchaeum sp. AArc-GB TaxID=3074078 RepID=UPI0028543316|nr:hypothetical protein [Halalkaliarchaeum sp. AArc-GB]MDR5673607.1 hypothetical protein [Halalkaliarchaeum sp. AArc-GB]